MLTRPAEPQLDLTNVFGVNVQAMFLDWFRDEYVPDFHARYGKDEAGGEKNITAILLDPRLSTFELIQAWSDPTSLSHITVHTGAGVEEESAAMAPGGTYENVGRKLRICLRYLSTSREIEDNLECLREGDFPWEGADEEGGVSGLKKEEDAAEKQKLSDKFYEFLCDVNKAAVAKAASLKGTPEHALGAKYLKGINVAEEFPGYRATPVTAPEYAGGSEG